MAMTSIQTSQSARRCRSEEDYKNAACALQKVIRKEIATKTAFPDFTVISGTEERARTLVDVVEKLIQERNEQRAKEYGVGDIVIGWFRASYPFANLFLTVLKDGASTTILNPYGLVCGGLLALMKIAYEETGKSDGIQKNLRFLVSVNQRLELNSNLRLHDVAEHLENLECAALDVSSTMMNYLSCAVRYFSKRLIINIGKSIIHPSTYLQDGIEGLNQAVQAYTTAIADLQVKLSVELFKQTQTLENSLDSYFNDLKSDLGVIEKKLQSLVDEQSPIREKALQEINDEFLSWLGPSHWEVERQLDAVRNQRQYETLHWVPKLREFQEWENSELHSTKRVLWLCGSAGIGKSVMAGFIIDYLQFWFPDSVIAYFFAKRGEARLEDPRAIVRTIVYQCMLACPEMRTQLKELKNTQFSITSHGGIRFLIDQLLIRPLSSIDTRIYIVLDGIDEVDPTKMDEERTEIEVAIETIAKFYRAQVLIISRPDISLGNVDLNKRKITEKDNMTDIEYYIRSHIAKLKPKFDKFHHTDIQDFVKLLVNRSNGLFLWVTTVLRELSNAKTKRKFEIILRDVNKSSGKMSELYQGILERISVENKGWVNEVLYWILATERPLSVKELEEFVNESLEDEMENFQKFLDTDCGSFIRIQVPESGQDHDIQFIHETFRNFLIDRQQCPKSFYYEGETIHNRIALQCLRSISRPTRLHSINQYAVTTWVNHLVKASLTPELLIQIYEFFTSEALQTWVKAVLCKIPGYEINGLIVRSEEDDLSKIQKWLVKACEAKLDVKEVKEWSQAIRRNPELLNEYVGKAAANVWLYEDIKVFDEARVPFLLALKYYKQQNSSYRKEELAYLSATRFKGISDWASKLNRKVNETNLGVAYFILHEWEACIECFEKDVNSNPVEFAYWRELSQAYLAKGHHDAAIRTLEAAVEKFPTQSNAWDRLSEAYKAKGDHDAAIRTLEAAVEKFPTQLYLWDRLSTAHKVKGDHDAAVRTFEAAVERFPTEFFRF